MAILNFNQQGRGVTVHLLSDPSTGEWFGGDSISRDSSSKGEVRHFSGGKRRAITWNAVDKNVSYNISFNTVDKLNLLESWIDKVIVFRDLKGEVVSGLLTSVTVSYTPSHSINYATANVTIVATTDDGVV